VGETLLALRGTRVDMTAPDQPSIRSRIPYSFGTNTAGNRGKALSPKWEWRLPPGGIIVEDYDLVVMSNLPKGERTLRLATCDFGPFGARTEEWLELAEIRVVD